jgi:hypothetical protein
MQTSTLGDERDEELDQLRAELAQQRAWIELLFAERAERQAPQPTKHTQPSPDAGRAPCPEGQPTSRHPLPRRGLMVGVAALVAGTLAKASEEVALAGGTQGTALICGDTNTATNGTSLARSPDGVGVQAGLSVSWSPVGLPANEAALKGSSDTVIAVKGQVGTIGPQSNLVAAVHGTCNSFAGVVGDSGSDTGVYGISGGTGPALAVAGVTGTSLDHFGVLGTSNSNTGVDGRSANGSGVAGHTLNDGPGTAGKAGVYGSSADGFGVAGDSSSNVGVNGLSTNSHGVFGRTSAAAGTVANGMLAAGLAGRTSSTIALYGYADGPPNPNYAPVGAVGQCQNGFGVWGLSSAGPGAVSRPGGGTVTAVSGLLGTSTSGLGVYAISSGSYALAADGNGPSTVGALLRGLGGGKAAVCVGDVEIQGHLTVTGGVNGPVATAAASEAAPTSLALVEAVGRGQVERGTATVALDPAVAAQAQGADYDIFLTSYDNVQLHVANRTPQGFEVRVTEGTGRAADITAGRATAAFSYRVVARRRPGAGSQRADAAPLHVPAIPTPQGVPTLPVGRETAAPPTRKPDER